MENRLDSFSVSDEPNSINAKRKKLGLTEIEEMGSKTVAQVVEEWFSDSRKRREYMSKWRVTFQDGDVQEYGFFPAPPMGGGKIEKVERIPDPIPANRSGSV